MDFHLDDDQLALRDTVARFCRDRWPLEELAERPEDAFDRSRWTELVELGPPSLMAPEECGGLGLGAVEGAVAFEQLGRFLVPGPTLWSALAALLIPELAHGECMAGGVEGDGASPYFVEYIDQVDLVLVLHTDRVARVDPARCERAAAPEGLDPLNPVGVVSALPGGAVVGDAADAARLRNVGTVLSAALQLGVAETALDVSVAYALEREQFGVPIGSFQALKHILADMYVRVGMARSATYAAAAVLDDPEVGHVERSLRGAKLLAGEAAFENGRAAVQVLGGMGFTWEMAPHFLLKRALVLDQSFGTPHAHALALGASLAEEAA
jgi:alkylation response protein AidB-like acyl-CoA dehydrogenase